jgi:hypothetical protein
MCIIIRKVGCIHALPWIRFDIMNSVNASTGFSNFQIHLGCSPHLIPPIVPDIVHESRSSSDEMIHAQNLIKQLQTDVHKAKDNLLQAKVFQSHYANLNRLPKIPFQLGDKVMLVHIASLSRVQEERGKMSV